MKGRGNFLESRNNPPKIGVSSLLLCMYFWANLMCSLDPGTLSSVIVSFTPLSPHTIDIILPDVFERLTDPVKHWRLGKLSPTSDGVLHLEVLQQTTVQPSTCENKGENSRLLYSEFYTRAPAHKDIHSPFGDQWGGRGSSLKSILTQHG